MPTPDVPATARGRKTRAALHSISSDQRGAVMVLGIFMCAVLVGMLWYIAGVGSAIMYRQRMQEASDATAFSVAVLNARGMNLIVMINILMAIVLAIRVILKMLVMILTILQVIFEILGVIPWTAAVFQPAARITDRGRSFTQQVLDRVNPRIDDALAALNKAATAVAEVVPRAAVAGAYQVAHKYEPPVVDTPVPAAGMCWDTVRNGLPVEEGSEDKLCNKAGQAVGELIGLALEPIGLGGEAGEILSDALGDMASGAPGYFCEMGSGGDPPNMGSITEDGARRTCDSRRNQLDKEIRDARDAFNAVCSATGAICIERDLDGRPKAEFPEKDPPWTLQEEADVNQARAELETAYMNRAAFDEDDCIREEKEKLDQQASNVTTQQSPSGSSGKKTPKKVKDGWHNGIDDAQCFSIISGDTSSLNWGREGVKVGAWRDPSQGEVTIPVSTNVAFAQAEFFFDCSGAWGGCNNDEEAMWHFRWRARLRRWNEPAGAASDVAVSAALLEYGNAIRNGDAAALFSLESFRNAALRGRLVGMAADVVSDPTNAVVH